MTAARWRRRPMRTKKEATVTHPLQPGRTSLACKITKGKWSVTMAGRWHQAQPAPLCLSKRQFRTCHTPWLKPERGAQGLRPPRVATAVFLAFFPVVASSQIYPHFNNRGQRYGNSACRANLCLLNFHKTGPAGAVSYQAAARWNQAAAYAANGGSGQCNFRNSTSRSRPRWHKYGYP